MQPNETEEDCRCTECGMIHEEFIQHFNKWPSMTHEEGQALKHRRAENVQSWEEAVIGEHIARDESTRDFGEALLAVHKESNK